MTTASTTSTTCTMMPAAIPSAAASAPHGTAPICLNTEHLATTTLAELNSAAGLLTRVDRKYLVPLNCAQELVDGLAPDARVLAIDEQRRFSYASTYFDTPGLEAFMLAARKRRRRFKVRTRTYLDSGLCFLEVKTRGARHHRQAAHGLPRRRRLPPHRSGTSLRGGLPGEHGGHRLGRGP